MKSTVPTDGRAGAIERATRFAPFLRDGMLAFPEIANRFATDGADAAVGDALALGGATVGEALRHQRRALALSVALGDLSGELSLERLTAALSDFADHAIHQALGAAIDERVPGAGTDGFTVLALGKLGSRELNYSSDVDLILLFDPGVMPRRERDDPSEAAVRIGRRLVELLQQRTEHGYVARVDLRLRPSPEVTPIVLPAEAAISYYESQALPWERAAFIRARACAGDIALGERFLGEIQPFIWRRVLDFGAIDEIRAISSRIRDHYAQGAALAPGYDLKRGLGGIREVEFYTQVQQLIHGGRDPGLRQRAVLDALPALVAADRLEADVAEALADAYRRLRTVEHRVQMIDDQQTHRLPVAADALDGVAGLDGLADGAALIESLRAHVDFVRERFDGLSPDQGSQLSNDPDLLADQLRAMGYADTGQVARMIAGWRSGQVRSLRSQPARAAFEAMLPVLLAAIAEGPDPGHALNRFSDIVERLSSGVNLYRLLEARPALAAILSQILVHAPALAEQLARRPGLFDGLIDESSFAAPPDAVTVAGKLAEGMTRASYDERLDRVRLLVGERRFALGVQLIARHRDPLDITLGYAAVAEGAIIALTDAARHEFEGAHGRVPGGEMMILGLGRLGGMALTHASDLDLIFLFDAPDDAMSDGAKSLGATDYFNRLAKRVVAALSVATAAGPLYDVDTRLRPQGEKGMLAVRLDAFETYQRSEAWTWEHMALLRARPLYGTEAGRAKLAATIERVLKLERDPAKVRADAAKMRGDMAAHKPPAGPLDIKLGPGGLVDLEFAVHTLQLTHRIGFDSRLEVAIEALHDAGLIEAEADADLRLLSRILVTSRLVTPGGGLPLPQSQALVAQVCGHPDWQSLLDAHDAARQRIAELWAKVKDGQ
ncbi:bifunctional [glutamine synthetase] adenylyltransferase/[glutamine synthetase]-adenylyl-L-tyrosine phosphorylase [Sphingomonas sp.]|uniref:bifunctional [glutamine synthetase] adenylyltransferase/[glutamine synthetase]-adenylyl-L-tyrosine phosphorylase n=1 Tax=Sphingomonas sp. TaxID=28214 RepID=UPI00286BE60A|nr:bifunctional [glutamine synthetase] adenylyltransferase/[glutamine synthetase]-adenylyl-L-tyrosine phosphorylase [Sphingomonas sp.]